MTGSKNGRRTTGVDTLPLRLLLHRAILSLMAQYSAQLDGVFVALADPTRRARRPAPRPRARRASATSPVEFPMTLPSFMKHVRTLESNGLIRTAKSGRVRTCVLNRERLALVDDWLAEQRRIWEERTDRLEQSRHRPGGDNREPRSRPRPCRA